MSHMDRIYTQLNRNTSNPGISLALLAARTKLNAETIYRRVHDLRAEGHRIYTNRRVVNGTPKTFYRLAA